MEWRESIYIWCRRMDFCDVRLLAILAVSCMFCALSLYQDRPDQVDGPQRSGGYCRIVCRWILCIWNGEIPSIVGSTGWISVISRFPRQRASWRAHRSRKELMDRAEILVCFRGHRTLLNAVFMSRLGHVLMEKMGFEIVRSGGDFGG